MTEEEFQDFSYASNWERFIGQIEQTIKNWIWITSSSSSSSGTDLNNEKHEVQIKHKLQFRREPYTLTLHTINSPKKINTYTISNTKSLPVETVITSEPSFSGESESSDVESQDLIYNEEINTEISNNEKIIRSDISQELFVSDIDQFIDTNSDINRWFGIKQYIILTPGNYTGRILDSQESGTISSAMSVALASIESVSIPILLPVFDQYRDGYTGVAVVNGKTVFLETDSTHMSSNLADELKTISRRLILFGSQMGMYCSGGAALCNALADNKEIKIDSPAAFFSVSLTFCATFKLFTPIFSNLNISDNFEDNGEMETEIATIWKDTWDDGCVWQPWAKQIDPIGSIELDLIKDPYKISTPLDNNLNNDMTEMALSSETWRLYVLAKERMSYINWGIFSRTKQYKRIKLCLPRVNLPLSNYNTLDAENIEMLWMEDMIDHYDEANQRSLSARLKELITSSYISSNARSIGELGDETWWQDKYFDVPKVPPDETLQKSVQDMFGDENNHTYFMTEHVKYNGDEDSLDEKMMQNSAPFDSLVWRLALHSVVYRNAKAVALLWGHFVHMVRNKHWEIMKLLPITGYQLNENKEPIAPDTNACLIHQKLELINICIYRRKLLMKRSKEDESGSDETNYESISEEEITITNGDEFEKIQLTKPKGDIGILKDAYLENYPDVPIRIPQEQLVPVFTSDMVEEQKTLQAALQDASEDDNERAERMQASLLLSDMAAFKAANPGCIMEDFVKWHSPKDWIISKNGEGHLSDRMSFNNDNRWHKFWKEVEACPASEQIPLMDPFIQGERALHYLETINPEDLFDQLSRISILACFGCLERSAVASKDWAQPEFKKTKDVILEFWKDPNKLDYALKALLDLERIVVAGESIMKRLPECPVTSDLIMKKILMIEDENSKLSRNKLPFVDVPESERPMLCNVISKNNGNDGIKNKKNAGHCLLQKEWLYTCESIYDQETKHRMYVKEGVDETRVATVIFSM